MLTVLVAGLGCSALPDIGDQPESYALASTQDTALRRAVVEQTTAHPGETGHRPLNSGLDAFVARVVLARAAQRTIDAQYYLLHDDLTGRLFAHELLRAADRGVLVRLLLDDMAIPGRDWQASLMAAHPNVELRIFNPFSRETPRFVQYVTRFGSVTRRMHNKSFTADNQVAILGGRNIGDEYFEASPVMQYGDLDVLLIGPAVDRVSQSFDAFWNSDLAYPIGALVDEPVTLQQLQRARVALDRFVAAQRDSAYARALRQSDLARELPAGRLTWSWGDAVVLADDPQKIRAERGETGTYLLPKLEPWFDTLDRELTIVSAYFVPGRAGTDFLTDLAERGVDVRILTNSLAATDVTAVHAGYARYREELLEAGVELYELKPEAAPEGGEARAAPSPANLSKASLHAKTFALDDEQVFIGSLNLDPRSATENTEVGVMLESPALATTMTNSFDQRIDDVAYRLELCAPEDPCEGIRWYETEPNGNVRAYDTEPHSSAGRRLQVRLLQLLPFESQL